jgi:hypothetical protein
VICNACPSKPECTDSDEGREIVRALDPWPHSEAGRFHRGVCLVLVSLAGLIALMELIRHHESAELLVSTAVLSVVFAAGLRLVPAFLNSPARFPGST